MPTKRPVKRSKKVKAKSLLPGKLNSPHSLSEMGLDLLAQGTPIRKLLRLLTEELEILFPDTNFLICFANSQATDIAVSPGLPDKFMTEVKGLRKKALQSTFFSNVKTKAPCTSLDIQSHPAWENRKELFSLMGRKFCHSLPILNAKGKFAGLICQFTKSKRPPTISQLALMQCVSQITKIAFDRQSEKQEVKKLRARLAGEEEERTQRMREAIRQLQDEIVQRKIIERSLKTSNEKLQNLSNHLEHVREEERTRISREIHDELGQMLTTLKMKLSILEERTIDEGFPIQEDIQIMIGLVETTLQTVRRISTELRPGILDVLGLSEAVEWQSQEFHEQTKIAIETDIQRLPENIGKDLSTACFRICQEALTNVARHAEANLVTVSLRHEHEKIEMIVRDNGIGITNEQLSRITSLGLIGMRERAQNLGGDLNIQRASSGGTEVSISFPLDLGH